MSSSTLGSSAACTLPAVTDGGTGQAVVPPRSVATSIGTCWCERPRLSALPPFLRGFRSRLRSPLRLSRMQVSSAKAMPFRFGGSGSCVPGNRCRHRNEVAMAGLQGSAESLTVFLPERHSPWASHLPFLCRPCRDVPVVALKVFFYMPCTWSGAVPVLCSVKPRLARCNEDTAAFPAPLPLLPPKRHCPGNFPEAHLLSAVFAQDQAILYLTAISETRCGPLSITP